MTIDMDVMREALLRAQYGRRETPRLVDFPPSVPPKEVEDVYLSFLTKEEAQMRQGLKLGEVQIVGYGNSSEVTLAGDAIAGALLLSNELFIETVHP
ncbi:hypothetical protein DQ04_01351110 [Trypanosoma grayi]|uniref:hypothetical protein n=1 Tax=Trypanosoma grayi TaxID=71804 RepID=UPI0004F3FFD3|nr:hypothetical protein DQ04_01351110 [Trypanosoma grayi]KEG12888.1 hypothetical protein DQ04_01351110 [Trypanosoma grayi]